MHEFNFWYALITIVVVFGALQGTAGFLVYVERKICAYMQDRIGPNRVGPFGLLQVLADGLKFVLKEEFIPRNADKVLFILAPCIAFTTAMLAFAVVPFGATEPAPVPPLELIQRRAANEIMKRPEVRNLPVLAQFEFPAGLDRQIDRQIAEYERKAEAYKTAYQFVIAPNIDIGILFIFAVTSLAVYGIILGGWASNNKYSMLGGLRSSAQIISYEIPLGMSILGVVLMTGSLNLERIIWRQAEGGFLSWNIFFQPLAFLLFLISAFAECNRLPFDLPESEQELIGGYHTEYNAFKLAFYFIGEYTHMITTSFLMVILFFGGWHFPWLATTDGHWLPKLIVFAVKVTLMILFYMLVRWTLPRFRFDQLMSLAWKVLIPLALINVVLVMCAKELEKDFAVTLWWLLPASILAIVGYGAFAVLPAGPRTTARI